MRAHLEAPGAIGLSHPPITPIHPVATIHPIPHVPLVAAPTPVLPAIPRTQYSPPVVHTPSPPVYHAPAPAYKPPSPHVTSYKEPAKPYAFEYGVHDEYSGANFNQAETSDAHAVTGSYSVALPDGRTQTVNYKADGYGYVADVTYQGQAHYPELKPQTYSKPAAPVYHG